MIELTEQQLRALERPDAIPPRIILTRNHQPVAKLVSEKQPDRKPRVPGLGKGMITIVSDDEDHLKDFAEYMP